jgi:hypothetical protein
VESYQNLQPDPNYTTVILLTKITQQLAEISAGVQVNSTVPSPFQLQSSDVCVNIYWFLSLVFGLSCALAATLVQQWARSYLHSIERHPAPNKKGTSFQTRSHDTVLTFHSTARIRSYLHDGIKTFKMRTCVEAIPALLHIALFLFFAGLVEFLWNINRGIAYAMLCIVIFLAGMYAVITVLPTVFRHCPYRTPLSHPFWRMLQILGLLRYTNSDGRYARISGGLTEGREMLATEDLPGRDQRDADALKWTMESLTEDSELETLIEGIPAFFATFSPSPSTSMVGLSEDLMHRITVLLQSCKEPSALSDRPRLKRVIACMNAFTSILPVIVMEQWRLEWILSIRDLTRAMTALKDDQVPAIVTIANSIVEITTNELTTCIMTWTKRSDPILSYSQRWHATDQISRALEGLEILKSMDSVVEMIPTFVESRRISGSEAERFRLGELLSQLQESYIPQLLTTCQHPTTVARRIPRQNRALVCMKALRVLASDLHFNIANAKALHVLRNDEISLVSLSANCTTARLACKVQLGIILSVWVSPDKKLFMKCYPTLDALKVLNPLEDCAAEADLWRQLWLGLGLYPTGTTAEALWESIQQTNGKLGDQSVLLGPDDLQYLDQLKLRTFEGESRSDCPHSCKFALTRGRTIILIAFLQSVATSPLPEDGLDITLETLQFITKSSLARFASRRAQAMLVELVGKTVRMLHSTFGGGCEIVEDIIGVLFDVLVTVGHPKSIKDAETFVNAYLVLEPDCEAATAALHQVRFNLRMPLNDLLTDCHRS